MTKYLRRVVAAVGLVVISSASAFAQAPTEEVEYYGRDAIGSIRVVFDANGAIVGRMDFAPFGTELRSAQNIPPPRFAGLVRDGEAGLDYAQARSYQVRTGRFNVPDSVYAGLLHPSKWNRYTYVANDPLGFADPAGQEQQAVNCGPGPQWCPGNIRIGPNEWIHQDSPFNAEYYGYQGGGEAAAAEAAYAANVSSVFAQAAARSFYEGGAASGNGGAASGNGTPRPSVTTDTTIALDGKVLLSIKEHSNGLAEMARRISEMTEPVTDPRSYAWFYAGSAVGGMLGLAGRAGALYLAQNTHFEGPSAGFRYSNGRLFQVRVGPVAIIRVDLEQMRYGEPPAWHVHFFATAKTEGIRFRIWP